MKFSIRLVIVLILPLAIFFQSQAQTYAGPIAKPLTGYGSDGTHTVDSIVFTNPAWPSKNIVIYHPSDITTKVPTIFYNHAFGGNDPNGVRGLINFVVKKGYAFVFVPYQTSGAGVTVTSRYENLLNGFLLAVSSHPEIFDTTRVGFAGWSFGGGAVFGNSYECFTTHKWGENGRFVFSMAPWYLYNITQAQLQSFPANTKLIVENYEDDVINDHRMGIDAFRNINIPAAEKDFILVHADTIEGFEYVADHGVPGTLTVFNALDYYAIYRLLDALCDYTFNGSSSGKNVALGNGSADQVAMPTGLKHLEQTDDPMPLYPESKYTFPCGSASNDRSAYCSPVTGIDKPVYETLQSTQSISSFTVSMVGYSAVIRLPAAVSTQSHIVQIFNVHGRLVFQTNASQTDLEQGLKWNTRNVSAGTYLISIKGSTESRMNTFFTLNK